MSVEELARLASVLGIDVPVLSAFPEALKRWPSEDDMVPSPQFSAKGWRNIRPGPPSNQPTLRSDVVETFGTQNLSTSLACLATFPADIAATVSEWLEAADGSVGLCLVCGESFGETNMIPAVPAITTVPGERDEPNLHIWSFVASLCQSCITVILTVIAILWHCAIIIVASS
jgi:hypothetical protein